MLRRSTKIQLVLFVIITLVGITYVGANYVGFTKGIVGAKSCAIYADFPDSGGIFTNAEVTYEGVTVGKVGGISLLSDGVRVKLDLDDCNGHKIPQSFRAVVADRSVVGEQYVNILPVSGQTTFGPPYMGKGYEIPMARNSIPVSSQVLLTNLDALVKSIDTANLRTAITELGTAFNNRGVDLGKLLDSSNNLLEAATENLPVTIQLLKTSQTVLGTQLDESANLQSFSQSLDLLSQQLKSSDVDIRHLLDTGPNDLNILQSFITNNRTDLGVTFANLATVGTLLVRHLDGLEEVFELYPALAAGSFTVLRDNVGALGFVLDSGIGDADCGSVAAQRQGYEGTKVRPPTDLNPQAPNTAARCTASPNTGTNVRGSQQVPGGDPISTAGGGVAYPRTTTDNTINVGDTGNAGAVLGDTSWIALLQAGLVQH
jgi:phospholipid/cholesterol/gamma-HCH transport system substrate-binding protein